MKAVNIAKEITKRIEFDCEAEITNEVGAWGKVSAHVRIDAEYGMKQFQSLEQVEADWAPLRYRAFVNFSTLVPFSGRIWRVGLPGDVAGDFFVKSDTYRYSKKGIEYSYDLEFLGDSWPFGIPELTDYDRWSWLPDNLNPYTRTACASEPRA